MTKWYQFSIVIGVVPPSERAFVDALVSRNAPAQLIETEEWCSYLTESEIREKLRDGIARYAGELR